MKGINIYNVDGKILTPKMIKEIKKTISNINNENVTLIIQGGILLKVKN